MFRFEHLAFNVPDVHAAVDWYVKHLGFVVMRAQDVPPHMTFVADAGKNMMFEFYSRADVPVFDPTGMHDVTMHLALHVDDMDAARANLIAAGAVARDEIATNPAGDKLCFLRDPHGVVLQLVQRKNRMLSE
jgi:catechol 2,3-dioxygenase-like lactoylglutathione lyase family enzyme